MQQHYSLRFYPLQDTDCSQDTAADSYSDCSYCNQAVNRMAADNHLHHMTAADNPDY